MDIMSLIQQSIYFKQDKLLGLSFEIKDGKIILDNKISIDISDTDDILKCIFESEIRLEKGMLFNIRQWLFNLAKSHRNDISMDRHCVNSCLVSFLDENGDKIYIKSSEQFYNFILGTTY